MAAFAPAVFPDEHRDRQWVSYRTSVSKGSPRTPCPTPGLGNVRSSPLQQLREKSNPAQTSNAFTASPDGFSPVGPRCSVQSIPDRQLQTRVPPPCTCPVVSGKWPFLISPGLSFPSASHFFFFFFFACCLLGMKRGAQNSKRYSYYSCINHPAFLLLSCSVPSYSSSGPGDEAISLPGEIIPLCRIDQVLCHLQKKADLLNMDY